MALVRNISGTSDNTPPKGYSSWKEFWESKMNRRLSSCSNLSCDRRADHGGHVKKVHGLGEWYIVPLCDKCNNPYNTDSFSVKDTDLLRVR